MRKIRVMSVFGTRPEAIKMCPLVKVLSGDEAFESIVCVTAQHREMLDQVLTTFDVTPDYDMNLMKAGQTLTTITTGILEGMVDVLADAKPDIVLVHGDTSTSMAAAMAAFYAQIPVGHVEAGLRSFDMYSPYPEEMNRVITGKIAEIHFAPTQRNVENLAREGITENVYVTGNTVIDALRQMVSGDYAFQTEQLLPLVDSPLRTIVMTAHRRENLGEPLENICRAVKRLVTDFPDTRVIYPVHLNPAVRNTVFGILGDMDRVHLIDPIPVEDMHNLINRGFLVMTDSGGLQEEAPALGKPIVVLRTETERPEVVEAGKAILAGVEEQAVYDAGKRLLTDEAAYAKMAQAENPYGDGYTSERIAALLKDWFATKA